MAISRSTRDNPLGNRLSRRIKVMDESTPKVDGHPAEPLHMTGAPGTRKEEIAYQSLLAEWFTAALDALPKKSGKTQKELAARLGVPQSALSAIKRGDRKFSAHEVPIVAEYLGVQSPEIRATVPAAEQEELEELRSKISRIQATLGLSTLHDVVACVRLLYEHGRKAFEAERDRSRPQQG